MRIRDGLDPTICAFLIRHSPAITTMQMNKKQTQFTTTHNATHTTSKLVVMVGQRQRCHKFLGSNTMTSCHVL